MNIHPGTHYVVAQLTMMGPPVILTFEEAVKAKQSFYGYVQDATCNWVKFYTIRGDGRYIFNGEFQQRAG